MMAVDLDDVFGSEVALAFRRQGDAAAATLQTLSQGAATYLNTLNSVMLREYTEPSFSEAFAMRTANSDAVADKAMSRNLAATVPKA